MPALQAVALIHYISTVANLAPTWSCSIYVPGIELPNGYLTDDPWVGFVNSS